MTTPQLKLPGNMTDHACYSEEVPETDMDFVPETPQEEKHNIEYTWTDAQQSQDPWTEWGEITNGYCCTCQNPLRLTDLIKTYYQDNDVRLTLTFHSTSACDPGTVEGHHSWDDILVIDDE